MGCSGPHTLLSMALVPVLESRGHRWIVWLSEGKSPGNQQINQFFLPSFHHPSILSDLHLFFPFSLCPSNKMNWLFCACIRGGYLIKRINQILFFLRRRRRRRLVRKAFIKYMIWHLLERGDGNRASLIFTNSLWHRAVVGLLILYWFSFFWPHSSPPSSHFPCFAYSPSRILLPVLSVSWEREK